MRSVTESSCVFTQDLTDMGKLEKMLPDLEKIILMPLKPYQLSAIGTRRRLSSGGVGNPEQQQQQQLHLGVMVSNFSSSSGSMAAPPLPQHENIPEEIFEVLKRVCSCILLSEAFHHGVVTVYVCLLERCLHREAFTNHQKQLFSAWIHRLRSVWNPPSIRKATDYKRK